MVPGSSFQVQLRLHESQAPFGQTFWSEAVHLDAFGGAAVVTVPCSASALQTENISALNVAAQKHLRSCYTLSVTARQVGLGAVNGTALHVKAHTWCLFKAAPKTCSLSAAALWQPFRSGLKVHPATTCTKGLTASSRFQSRPRCNLPATLPDMGVAPCCCASCHSRFRSLLSDCCNVKVYSVAEGCGPLIVQVPFTAPWSPLCVQVADGCGALALHIMPRYVLYNMMGEIKYKQQVG